MAFHNCSWGSSGNSRSRPLGDLSLELSDQFAEVLGVQLAVELNPASVLFCFEQGLKRVFFFFVFGPQAHDYVAVHLHERRYTS